MKLLDRLSHAWNAFTGNNKSKNDLYSPPINYSDLGVVSSTRPDRVIVSRKSERSIVNSIFNRISIDCAQVDFRHIILDSNNRYKEDVHDGINNCLTLETNKDQTALQFKQDLFTSLFDEGCVALVPIDTTIDPYASSSYDIETIRVGRIINWYPDYVKIEVYNDRKGIKQEILMPKSEVAIIENPFYSVMNAKNSMVDRLITKLNILDAIDKQVGSGKLDLIIQLPYVIKTEARKKQADLRKQDIEDQLYNSKYGIAYTDGTEKITQLNRPVENNIMSQVEYLTQQLYTQFCITQTILDGTADEKTMINYHNRCIKPICKAVSLELTRKFLTKTARTQGHRIMFFSDPFELVPISQLAEIADKFTRNEILSSNEVRQIAGFKPSDAPEADELRNKNLNPGENQHFASTTNNDVDDNQDNYQVYEEQTY